MPMRGYNSSLSSDIHGHVRRADRAFSPIDSPGLCCFRRFVVRLHLCALMLLCLTGTLSAQAPNPSYLLADPSVLQLPGTITLCTDIPNISIDFTYNYYGVELEEDGWDTGSDGCFPVYYPPEVTNVGDYVITGVRNSFNGPNGGFIGTWSWITLCAYGSPSIASFNVDPIEILQGDPTTISWSSDGGDAYLNGQYVGNWGLFDDYPDSTTTYTLALYNCCGSEESASATVYVTPLYDNGQFVGWGENLPTATRPDLVFHVTITMKNNGTTTWTPSQYSLHALPNSDCWGISSVALGQYVEPGGLATFSFYATAPHTSGNYTFQWQMWSTSANGNWIGSATPQVPIGNQWQNPTSMSFSPTSSTAGNGHTYTVTVGNGTGLYLDMEYTWSVDGYSHAIRVDNWGPLDANGMRTVSLEHCDTPAIYRFTRIKNHLNNEANAWTTLEVRWNSTWADLNLHLAH